ncbi:hypothetical protein D3C87_1637900 [compost metagenome]
MRWCAAISRPGSIASWRCAAIRPRASASPSRRIRKATRTPPTSWPVSGRSATSTSRWPPIRKSIRRAPIGVPISTISSARSMPAPTAPSPRCSSPMPITCAMSSGPARRGSPRRSCRAFSRSIPSSRFPALRRAVAPPFPAGWPSASRGWTRIPKRTRWWRRPLRPSR